MRFAWENFVEVAEFLQSQNKDAYLRSAVSRAYYAACCTLRDALNIQVRNKSVHKELGEKLRKCNKYYADLLRRLRVLRNSCDYENSYRINRKDVESAIKDARVLIEGAETLKHCNP